MNTLDDIAITIDRDGFDTLDPQIIDAVLDLAEAADASPVLSEVFGDEHEPAPVRERAFGLLAMQITSAASASARTSSTADHGRRRRTTGSAGPMPCTTSTTRPRRSRVPVPQSGAEWRGSRPVGIPNVR